MPWSNAALAAALLATPAAAATSVHTAPVQAAQAWLAFIDHGDYAQSWKEAGDLFRADISATEWAHKVGQARGPFGAVISRTFAADHMSTSLPGAPDGAYDQVKFTTVFAHKRAAVETVVLAHEHGAWRVDGYFIR